MFLIPACVALAADSLVVYLHRSLLHDVHQAEDEEEERGRALYRVGYLALMAWLRILVLVLPLLFHSYTGTALPCHFAYVLWYTVTLLLTLSHMMMLTLLRPESLQALVPEPAGFLADLHLYRRLWYTLILSVLSNLAHFMLVAHVKSSAPPSIWRHGGVNGKPPVSLYFAIRAHPVLQEEPALVHAMNEFVVDMHARLQRTQQEWTKRLEDFSQRYNPRNGAVAINAQSHQSFQVLLQLFAYQDVLENGQLEQVWQADGGQAVTFMVPQLLSFLLHGAPSMTSKPLEEWILQHCGQNVVFAHHCFWFLRAWCLEVPLTVQAPLSRTNSEGQLSRRSSLNSVNAASSAGLVPFLDEPASVDVVGNNMSIPSCGDSVSRFLSSSGDVPVGGIADDKFLPQERLVIEHLMLRVKECGEKSAKSLMVGQNSSGSSSGSDTLQSKDDGFHEDSMMLDRHASLPVNPQTGAVSQRHLETITSPRRYGFLPISFAQQCRYTDAKSALCTQVFDETPRFWDSLIHLADSLFEVDRNQRKRQLRAALQTLECEVLPHNAIYVPLHHTPHRVWRIVPEESMPLGTKERVPCIVTLEVVQAADDSVASGSLSLYSSLDGNPFMPSGCKAYARRTRRHLSFMTLLDHLPGRQPSLQSAYSASMDSLDSDDEASPSSNDMDEFDMVQAWRYKPRHPLRRVPFVSKVADSMKGGLKRVSDTVRERLERDRTVSEELQALTLAESLVSSSHAEVEVEEGGNRRRRKKARADEAEGKDTARDTSISLADRASSGNSLVGMGQWGTSQPVRQALDSDVQFVRRRHNDPSTEPSHLPQQSNALVYGYGTDDADVEAGHDGVVDDTSMWTNQESPSPLQDAKEAKRPPPVVFKESWHAKQERIRKTSAYGNHPGWRLLPVLIKANDDLRQEQLASQLIYKMASILAREKCPVWLCPYKILALTESGGIIEAIPDTISLDSLKRNDPNFINLRGFFHTYYGEDTTALASAKANFVESLAAYSMVCFLLQIKDRHNGNILLDSQGHVVHIDFGFFFLSSPGKNAGFESAPFKLTREFVDLLDGPSSHLFHVFRELCVRAFLALRKHCMEIILLVEMLKTGNEQLKCFRGRPDDAISQLRERFRLDLNDRACREYVYSLIDNSFENWRTDWYDRYQRYFVGVL